MPARFIVMYESAYGNDIPIKNEREIIAESESEARSIFNKNSYSKYGHHYIIGVIEDYSRPLSPDEKKYYYEGKKREEEKARIAKEKAEKEAREAREKAEREARYAKERTEKAEREIAKREELKKIYGKKWKLGIILHLCLCVAYLFILYGTDIVRSPWKGNEFTFMRCIPLIIFSLVIGMVSLIFLRKSDYISGTVILIVMILIQSITICAWKGNVGILLIYLIGRIMINTLCTIPGAIITSKAENMWDDIWDDIWCVVLCLCLCVAYLFILYGTDIVSSPWKADKFTFMCLLPFIIFSLAIGIVSLIFLRNTIDVSGIFILIVMAVMILIQTFTICVWKIDVYDFWSVFINICLFIAYLVILYGTDIVRVPWEDDFYIPFWGLLPLIILSFAIGICVRSFNNVYGNVIGAIIITAIILIQSITICVWKSNVGILLIYLIGRIIINTLCTIPFMLLFPK